jgi:hypothetical protein
MKIKYPNILLLIVSLLVTYLVVEFLVFSHFIRYLPLNRHLFLPESVQLLAQSSKKGLIPQKDYIALFGDSYALGYGDWLFKIDPNKNTSFHSAHVLQELTGKDVVSFGKSNRGSLGGIAIQPIKKYEYINNLLLYNLTEPHTALIYFYEGNDFNDNLKRIKRKYTGKYDPGMIYEEDYFRKFIDETVTRRTSFNFFKNFIFGRFIFGIIGNNISSLFFQQEEKKDSQDDPLPDPTIETNKIKGSEIVNLPPFLQGPALGFDSDQMKLSLYVLEQSLNYIKNYFKETQFFVVYIPSVLSSYTITSQYVSESKSGNRVFPTEDMYKNSSYIAARVQELSEKNGMCFIDIRDNFRNATKNEIIHGPKDWEHLNMKGYQLLARSVFEGLKKFDMNCD